MVRLTDSPDMTLDVYHGRKTTLQQQQQPFRFSPTSQPSKRKFHTQWIVLLFLYIPKLCENKALVRKNQSQQYLVDCLAFCQCTGVRCQNDVSGILFSF